MPLCLLSKNGWPAARERGAGCAGPGKNGGRLDNGGRCRHRPPLVPALTAVAGWRGHLSLGGFGIASGEALRAPRVPERGQAPPFGPRRVSGGAVRPLADPLRAASGRTEIPLFASLGGPGRLEACRFQGSHRGRNPSGRPSQGAGPRVPSKQYFDGGPEAFPLCRSRSGPKPFATPFGSRTRPKPGAVSLPARAAGRFPRPSPVRPVLRPPREPSALPWEVS